MFPCSAFWHDMLKFFISNVVSHGHFDEIQYFRGCNAVDTIFNFLISDPYQNMLGEIDRSNAFKVCCKYYEIGIIVVGTTSQTDNFNDDDTLYCIDVHSCEDISISNNLSTMYKTPKLASRVLRSESMTSSYSYQLTTPDHNSRADRKLGFTPQQPQSPFVLSRLQTENDATLFHNKSPLRCLSAAGLNLSSVASSTPHKICDTFLMQFDDDTIYELALFQLLTIFEIPVLDAILQMKNRSTLRIPLLTAGSNFKKKYCSKSVVSLSSVGGSLISDEWIVHGFECIELTSVLKEKLLKVKYVPNQRTVIFEHVVKTYKQTGSSLLPEQHGDIIAQLHVKLARRNYDTVTNALQLMILMLPSEMRLVIERLLRFMATVCKLQNETRLQPDISNLDVCLTEFVDAFIPASCGLRLPLRRQLLDFLLARFREISIVPKNLAAALKEHQRTRMYTVAEPKPLVRYCVEISEQVYNKEAISETEKSLINLANSIIDDSLLTLDEKKRWLIGFKEKYPDLCSIHFSNVQW